jgi:hypothetical protein
MLIVEIHAGTAATHHAVPTGAGGSAPDVRQGALGGRRVRRDVVTLVQGGPTGYSTKDFELVQPVHRTSTAPDLVTSTVHNPRTLAATSDPGTHDPTAATPAGGP